MSESPYLNGSAAIHCCLKEGAAARAAADIGVGASSNQLLDNGLSTRTKHTRTAR